LSEGEFEEIAEHVEQCVSCESAVLTLEGAPDTVISALRKPAPADPVMAEGACQRAVEKIQALADSVVEARGVLETPVPPDSDVSLDFLAPAKTPDELGRLGSYRILKKLGAGGMGIVFLAEDVQLKRQVALKILHPEVAVRRGARERFLREAQAAATLEHENIVTIFQVGEESGVPFFAMQLLKGMSLEDYLWRGESAKPPGLLSVPQILRLVRQIARGLAAAHERGLIHRDIKPANLWLEDRSEPRPTGSGGAANPSLSVGALTNVKILDFGLARPVADDARLTQSGAIVGTPTYMAPEQARSEEIGPRCDLFSLGVVLYRMCTGRLPFTGRGTMAVLASLALDTPKSVSDLNPALPPELADLVMQLLNKDPAKRPASAKDVAQRLADLEARLTGTAQAAPLPLAMPVTPTVTYNPWVNIDKTDPRFMAGRESVARLESAKGVLASKPRPSKAPGVPPRRRRLLLVAAAALILLAGITTIRIATDKGELDIKADESVEVTIKRNGKPVEDLELKEGRNVTTVYSGDIEVVLKGANADEFVIKNDHITLKRGDKPVVEIERKPKPAVPARARAADADRKAAEWVLSVGGTMRVLADNELIDVSKEPLPKGSFRIKVVNIHAKPLVKNAHLEHLSVLTELQELSMGHNPQLDDDSLKPLRGLTTLRALRLNGNHRLSDAGLQHLQWLKNLQSLALVCQEITDAGLERLKVLTELRSLSLNETQVSDAGLAHLHAMTKLEALALGGSPQLTGTGFKHLQALPNLNFLHLTGRQFPESTWEHFGELTNLETLVLNDSNVTDAGLVHLRTLTKLRGIELHRTPITDTGLMHLKELTNLTSLGVERTKVTPAGLDALRKAMPKCAINGKKWEGDADRRAAEWVLSIGGSVSIVVDGQLRGVSALKDLPTQPFRVHRVDLWGNPRVDEVGLAHLEGLSELHEVELAGLRTDRELRVFKNLPQLRWLSLHQAQIGDAGLEHLKTLNNLTYLNLTGTQVKDDGLIHLKGLTNLASLSLGNTAVSDDGLVHLKGLTKLTVLGLGGTRVSDAGVGHLKGLKRLTELGLGCPRLTDLGIKPVAELTRLEKLWLTGSSVSDQGLKHLYGLDRLKELDLTGTEATADGVAALAKALPKCKIKWDDSPKQ
jgi:serine/threonine protein kinase/Leucine-rich repeat (LRR) protein